MGHSSLIASYHPSTTRCLPLSFILERRATLAVCTTIRTTWRIITVTGPDLTTTYLLLGAVLADLVQAYPDIKITALVRNLAHSAALKANNKVVDVVEGSFSDIALIASKARDADITFNTGDSDDVELTKTILAGQKLRVTEDLKSPAALLHISGVAVFADGTTDGKHDPEAKVWNVRLQRCITVRAQDGLIFHGWPCRMAMRQISAPLTLKWCMAT